MKRPEVRTWVNNTQNRFGPLHHIFKTDSIRSLNTHSRISTHLNRRSIEADQKRLVENQEIVLAKKYNVIMASPPHRSSATSPSYPSSTPQPSRKRPLPSHSTSSPYPAKRANASFSASSSSHPLRQTSFPPEEGEQGERSPSVDSIITTGTGARSATAGARPKKRGRKRKEDTQSVRSGTRDTPRDTASRTSKGPGDEEQDIEDEDEGDRTVDILVQAGAKDDDEYEQQRIAVLMSAFNMEQSERYDVYRRVKLRKETVRKIVNQTLSQSVPPSVVTTINGFAKVFLAELIEGARDIQNQSVTVAERSLPTPPELSPFGTSALTSQFDEQVMRSPFDDLPLKTDTGYMGPLLPDHLREALRRYRNNGEGGGAGVEGRSVGLGIAGSAAIRLRGRRLFR